MLGGCGRLHTCFRGFVNGVTFCGLMRLLFRLEARSARRDVLRIGTSDVILTVSSFRCTEGVIGVRPGNRGSLRKLHNDGY